MPSAFLKVVSGSRQGLNVPLNANEPLVIGRKRGDLVLDDPLVSSTHAKILCRDDAQTIPPRALDLNIPNRHAGRIVELAAVGDINAVTAAVAISAALNCHIRAAEDGQRVPPFGLLVTRRQIRPPHPECSALLELKTHILAIGDAQQTIAPSNKASLLCLEHRARLQYNSNVRAA